jgi:hypothetical protein
MLANTHFFVFEQAWKRIGGEIKERLHKETILKAVYLADFPVYRPFYHFYDPYYKKGLWFFGNAKKVGMNFYNLALSNYLNGSYILSSYFLGLSIHILSDLSIPAHVRRITHYTDDHEEFLEKNFNKLKFKSPTLVKKNNAEDYFEDLAIVTYDFQIINSSFFRDVFRKYLYGKKAYLLDEKILMKQSREILYLSSSYILGLLSLFQKTIAEKRKLQE